MSTARAFWTGFFAGFGPGALFEKPELYPVDSVFLPENDEIEASEFMRMIFGGKAFLPGSFSIVRSSQQDDDWTVRVDGVELRVTKVKDKNGRQVHSQPRVAEA